jgi:hypothetical protein
MADLKFARQIGEMLEQISYIDDCDTVEWCTTVLTEKLSPKESSSVSSMVLKDGVLSAQWFSTMDI